MRIAVRRIEADFIHRQRRYGNVSARRARDRTAFFTDSILTVPDACIPFGAQCTGEVFDTGKIRAGLGSLPKLYVSKGYLDVVPAPATQKLSDAKVMLTFEITEGLQYRMGPLEIEGDSDLGDQLRLHWELKTGEPYDANYLTEFLEANRSHLPAQFQLDNDVAVLRDCRDMTVTVHIELDPKRGPRPPLQEHGCQKDKGAAK
jgi:outer membrane protein assembly factor BamA